MLNKYTILISILFVLSVYGFPVFDNEMEIFGDDSGGFMNAAEVAPLRSFKIYKMFPAKMNSMKRSLKPVQQQQYTFNNHIEDYLPMPIKTLTPLYDHYF